MIVVIIGVIQIELVLAVIAFFAHANSLPSPCVSKELPYWLAIAMSNWDLAIRV